MIRSPDIAAPDTAVQSIDRAASLLSSGVLPPRHELDTLLAYAKIGVAHHRAEISGRLNQFRAGTDPTTALPNRLSFFQTLQSVVESPYATAGSMFLVGLENYRDLNQTLGHQIGNDILRAVAHRLRSLVDDDAVIARMTGVEFGVLAPRVSDRSSATVVAEKIANSLQCEPINLNDHVMIDLTCSIGIAMYPTDAINAADLVQRADLALNRARRTRAGRFSFYRTDFDDDARRRTMIKVGLRQALDEDQLRVYYQPKIDMLSNRIIGMEALLRWQHPDHGLIPPGEFIPIAESTGIITPVSNWMVSTACKQTRQWNDAGLDLKVAVNLSTVQFRRQSVVGTITQLVEDSGLDPKRLEVEVTESAMINPDSNVIDTFEWLRSLGIPITIDDFGTGYSSLSYLAQFPADVVKIDASFTRRLSEDVQSGIVTAKIVELAHNLGMKVVAEGVESDEQLNYLRMLECDYAQGFLFARPLPADAFERFVHAYHATQPSCPASRDGV